MQAFFLFLGLSLLTVATHAIELVHGDYLFRVNPVNQLGRTLKDVSLSLQEFSKNRIQLSAHCPGYVSSVRDITLNPEKKTYSLRMEMEDPRFYLETKNRNGKKVKFVADLDQTDVYHTEVFALIITLIENGYEDFLFYEVQLKLNGKKPTQSIVLVGKRLGYKQILVEFPRKILESKNTLEVNIPEDLSGVEKEQKVRFQSLHETR